MKAIFNFITLLLIVTTAVSSATLYLNENYIVSAVLCVTTVLSVSFWINYAGVNILYTENHAQ
jgi:hypothetical protein